MKAPTLPLLDQVRTFLKDRGELNRIGSALEMEVARKSYLTPAGRTMIEQLLRDGAKVATRLGVRTKYSIGDFPTKGQTT